MSENILKVWGERRRIFLNDKVEIDYVKLKKDSFCSTHTHNKKHNKFVVIKGLVKVETELGEKIIYPGDSLIVIAPMKHRFIALQESEMVEIAFVKNGKIDPEDINRESQGGLIMDGKEYTLDELKKENVI